jgi:hypothetical protein
MFLEELSRYRVAELIKDADESLSWTVPRTLEYNGGADDDIHHEVQLGDTWHLLAHKFYGPDFGGARLWWAIVDYQPTKVIDPTVALKPGDIVVIPSPLTIQTFVLGVDPQDVYEAK